MRARQPPEGRPDGGAGRLRGAPLRQGAVRAWASAEGNYDGLGQELDVLARTYDSSADLRLALENPVVKASEKLAILRAILPRIAPSLPGAEVRAAAARARPHHPAARPSPAPTASWPTSAPARCGPPSPRRRPCPPADLDRVRRALEKRTGKKVIVETAVDANLIGGIVARVGDLVLDGSVRAQLEEMRRRLLN